MVNTNLNYNAEFESAGRGAISQIWYDSGRGIGVDLHPVY